MGVAKTANGRVNHWEPNSANVPEEMRDIWIPDSSEHIILSADASQIEWRLAMVLSGDPTGLALLASGVDNHRAVAAETLRKRIEDIDDTQRHASKFIVYGLGYGRGADSISTGHKLDIRFVHDFIAGFSNRFNVFWAWRNALPDQVKQTNFLANPWGRRRWWYTRNAPEVYNFPASSCAADMMIDELIMVDRQLPKGASVRLTVHDEIVVVAAKDVVREAWTCLKDVMQQKWPKIVEASRDPAMVKRYYPDGWFCPAELHLGTNWKMCKSKDPEDKLARAALEKEFGVS